MKAQHIRMSSGPSAQNGSRCSIIGGRVGFINAGVDHSSVDNTRRGISYILVSERDGYRIDSETDG